MFEWILNSKFICLLLTPMQWDHLKVLLLIKMLLLVDFFRINTKELTLKDMLIITCL